MLFFVSCKLLDLKSILPNISIASLALFCFLFTGNVFFHPFNLFVFLILEWVSNRQYIVGPCIFSLLPSCLLTGELNLLTFEVITDKEELTSVIVLFSKFFLLSFPAFLSFVFQSTFFVVKCLNSFLIFFFVYSLAIFFVTTVGIIFNILKLQHSYLTFIKL